MVGRKHIARGTKGGVLNTMDKYLEYNGNTSPTSNGDGGLLVDDVVEVENGKDHPGNNVRLSPRKHASTLSRCAETSKENVKTPHRISLCEVEAKTLNSYTKRTRRRLNVALDEESRPPTEAPPSADNEKREGDKVAVVPPKRVAPLNSQNGHHANGTSNGTANGGTDRKMTEFFPVRRSVRKTKKEVLEEKLKAIEMAILDQKEDGLEVAVFEGRGRGVVAARVFRRGDFVVEYAGELVELQEAKEREKHYAQDTNKGCYMYYFKHNNTQYCIDATAESGRLGRLVNHSRNGNLVTKPIFLEHRPHLVLLAAQDILPGEELRYDYGDRSKESLMAHPWLAF